MIRYLRNRLFLKRHHTACRETQRIQGIGDRRALKRAVARKMREEMGLEPDRRIAVLRDIRRGVG